MGGPASATIVAIILADDIMAMWSCFRGSRPMAGTTLIMVMVLMMAVVVLMMTVTVLAVDTATASTRRAIDKPGSCTSPLECPPRLGVLAEIDIVP